MMQAHVLLCDHAQVADGKLFISGAGISVIPRGIPTAIALLIHVPWDRANTQIPYTLHVENSDGSTDLVAEDDGPARIEISGQFEVGRPPGLTRGTSLDLPAAISVPPLDLSAGRYMWRLTIAGETNESWTASFNIRA